MGLAPCAGANKIDVTHTQRNLGLVWLGRAALAPPWHYPWRGRGVVRHGRLLVCYIRKQRGIIRMGAALLIYWIYWISRRVHRAHAGFVCGGARAPNLTLDMTLIGTFCNAFCVNRHDGGLTYAPGTVDGTVSSLVEVARDRGAGGVARVLLSGLDNDSSIDAHCYGSGTGGCVVEPPRSRGMMCVSDELPGYVSHAAFVCRRAPSRSVR